MWFQKNSRKEFLDPDEVLVDSISAMRTLHYSEGKIERPIERISYTLFLVLIVGTVGYMGWRASTLQVASGSELFKKSQENRFVVEPIPAPRGLLYDYQKKPLVENYPSFGVSVTRDEFFTPQAAGFTGKETVDDLVTALSKIFGKPKETFTDLIQASDPRRLPAKVVVADGIAPENVVPLASKLRDVRGAKLFESFRRVYKYPQALSHLVGFVGKVSETDLLRDVSLNHQEYIGKNGIELSYNDLLHGKSGRKIIETDAAGSETRYKLLEDFVPGSNLVLTIDGALQEKIYETLARYTEGRKGASAVAIDPRDGAIRALVSFPGFDSNSFGYSLSIEDFQAVLQNPLKPLFNRAVAGEFPSGSVIKPLFAAAALQENLIDPAKKIFDGGYIEIPNPYRPGEVSRFVDWKKDGHGWVDMYDAIAYSVNVYFYMIGGGYKGQEGLGIARIKSYAAAFGLGSLLGIDIPGEKPGLIPDPEWKEYADKENPIWRVGDTYNVSIGQGGFKITPLQMASLTAALANGGKLYQPHVFAGVLAADGSVHDAAKPKVLREGMVDPEAIAEVKKGMRQTVTDGTARFLQNIPVPLAAKTGTAQAGSGLPHAWVTAFGPYENPELVIVVMVEHAGEGSTVAVPITSEILQWHFSR